MTTLDRVNNTIGSAEEITRKAWLASLGAYGKGFEEIQSQYEKFNGETMRMFEELVTRGTKIEKSTKEKVKEKTSVEQRVKDVRRQLGLDNTDTASKIDELSKKVDALAAAVKELS